jgi:hypothetical protein
MKGARAAQVAVLERQTVMFENLTRAEYEFLLRHDFATFAGRCFQDLNPQTDLALNWHLEVIAAKLTEVREGKIRRLIINMSHYIDFIGVIFHPRGTGGPLRLSTAVGWNEQRGRAAMDFAVREITGSERLLPRVDGPATLGRPTLPICGRAMGFGTRWLVP